MVGILTDGNFNVVIENGQMAVGNADACTAQLLIVSNRGDFKEHPLIGGEASRLLGSTTANMWTVNIKKQLASVGIEGAHVSISSDGITVTTDD